MPIVPPFAAGRENIFSVDPHEMELDILIDGETFKFRNSSEGVQINDQMVDHKIQEVNENHWLIHAFDQVFDVEFVSQSGDRRMLKINGKSVESTTKSEMDLLLKKMGMSTNNHKEVKERRNQRRFAVQTRRFVLPFEQVPLLPIARPFDFNLGTSCSHSSK